MNKKSLYAGRGALSAAIVTMGWAMLSDEPGSPFRGAPLSLRLIGGALLCLPLAGVAAAIGAALGALTDRTKN